MGMNVVSPTSTNQQLLQDHRDLTSQDERLRQMYDYFPHHNSSLSIADLAKLREGKDWNEIIQVPAWLEGLPKPLSPQKGQQSSVSSAYSRSSYKAGPSFTLPPISEVNETPFTPQRHVSWPDQPTSDLPHNTWAASSSVLPHTSSPINPPDRSTSGPSYNAWVTPPSAPPHVSSIDPSFIPYGKPAEQSNVLLGIAAPKPTSSFQSGLQGTYKDNVIPLPSSYFSEAPRQEQPDPPKGLSFPWWSSVSTGGRNVDEGYNQNAQGSGTREPREDCNAESDRRSNRDASSDGEESAEDAFSS